MKSIPKGTYDAIIVDAFQSMGNLSSSQYQRSLYWKHHIASAKDNRYLISYRASSRRTVWCMLPRICSEGSSSWWGHEFSCRELVVQEFCHCRYHSTLQQDIQGFCQLCLDNSSCIYKAWTHGPLEFNITNITDITFFTTINMSCYNWNNITFTWVHHQHHFYYTPITTSHISSCQKYCVLIRID